MEDPNFWWRLINSVGVVGVLFFGIWIGLKGYVWPKNMVDRTIAETQKAAEQTAKILGTEIKEGIKTAVQQGVERGIMAAHREINGTKRPKAKK